MRGFVDYIYANPDTGEPENKISYVAPINGTNYFIGAGTYEGIINGQVNSVRTELEAILGDISTTLVIFLLIAAVIFTLIILFISRYISKNINKVLVGMNKMAAGDLTYRMDMESKDEIGKLAQAYNKTAAAQKEMDKSSDQIIKNVKTGTESMQSSIKQVNKVKDNSAEIGVTINNLGNLSEMSDNLKNMISNFKVK